MTDNTHIDSQAQTTVNAGNYIVVFLCQCLHLLLEYHTCYTEQILGSQNTFLFSLSLNLSDLYEKIAESEKRVLMAIHRMQADIANSIERLVQAVQNNHPGPQGHP